jgi:transcriptional regulator with XRE-family HTH domain
MVDYRQASSLGERIQTVRKARGIRSTQALADLIDTGSVSAATLQNIETGRLTNVSLSQLLNIAFALKVAPSLLLAPVGQPDAKIDLPNLSSGLQGMSATEFDAWLAGLNTGAYRPGSPAEMAERNELTAYRELQDLLRERRRLIAIAGDQHGENEQSRGWTSPSDKLAALNSTINEITEYLDGAGWPPRED